MRYTRICYSVIWSLGKKIVVNRKNVKTIHRFINCTYKSIVIDTDVTLLISSLIQ